MEKMSSTSRVKNQNWIAAVLGTVLAVVAFLLSMAAYAADSAVVLMYHRFGEDKYSATSIRLEQFEAQLEHLRERGYAVVPLARVLESLAGGEPLPERAVAITIDDAYLSVYTAAFPRFRAAGMPFTVFVSTDPVDQGLPDYMSWEQMREMAEAGATFANHGAAHDSVLERNSGEERAAWLVRVRANVEKGADRLAEELEPLTNAFAYPYGEYTAVVADMLRDMGYVSFGQQSGAVGPHSDTRALPRFPMAEAFGGMDQFPTKVASQPLPVVRLEPWEPVTASAMPSIEITLGEADARFEELACFVSGQGRVDVSWEDGNSRFSVGPAEPFGTGRQRVNCTAPRNDGGYLWFSHQWIIERSGDDP